MKICSVCGYRHYAKGYCRNHYAKFKRYGKTDGLKHKCGVEWCNRKCIRLVCSSHRHRVHNGIIDSKPKHPGTPSGSGNPRWSGGSSEYKYLREMKLARLTKLKSVEFICELCGSRAYIVHHKDGLKDNHSLSNLLAVCPSCHFRIHHI